MSKRNERRKGDRIDANLKVEVAIPQPDGGSKLSQLESLNISTSGIYFKSDHFIEPMTKLGMTLELPVLNSADEVIPEAKCEGIVVRILPEFESDDIDNYEVAVFFTHIDTEGVSHLEEHISALVTAQ